MEARADSLSPTKFNGMFEASIPERFRDPFYASVISKKRAIKRGRNFAAPASRFFLFLDGFVFCGSLFWVSFSRKTKPENETECVHVFNLVYLFPLVFVLNLFFIEKRQCSHYHVHALIHFPLGFEIYAKKCNKKNKKTFDKMLNGHAK